MTEAVDTSSTTLPPLQLDRVTDEETRREKDLNEDLNSGSSCQSSKSKEVAQEVVSVEKTKATSHHHPSRQADCCTLDGDDSDSDEESDTCSPCCNRLCFCCCELHSEDSSDSTIVMGRSDICNKAVGTSFQAQRWMSVDTCGFLAISLSWFVHFYALFVLAFQLTSGSAVALTIFFLMYVPSSVLAMSSLYMAWTSDPGAVPLGARPLVRVRRAASGEMVTTSGGDVNGRAIRRCHKCQDNFKPLRAHHDSVTGRCVVKFDHFCPWVDNAIGALNHKFFCLFLLYTATCCLISLLLLMLRAIRCGFVYDDTNNGGNGNLQPNKAASLLWEGAGNVTTSTPGFDTTQPDGVRWLTRASSVVFTSSSTQFVYSDCNDFYGSHAVLILFVISLVFLVFTCSMGCEQIEAIRTGKGKIARIKMSAGQAGTEYSQVTEEFNEMFGGDSNAISWHWFIPTPVRFPRGMKKVVLGFDWDDSFAPVPYQEHGDATIASSGLSLNSGVTHAASGGNPHRPLNANTQLSVHTDVELGDIDSAAANVRPSSAPGSGSSTVVVGQAGRSTMPSGILTREDSSSSAPELSRRGRSSAPSSAGLTTVERTKLRIA